MAEINTFPTTSRQLAVSLPSERTNVCVGADTYSIVFKGTDTNDKFSFIDMLIPPGGGPMPHAHECEEMFYVVEGEVTVFCHDGRTLAATGSAVNIPGWAPHVFHNLSTVPARLFCGPGARVYRNWSACRDAHNPSPAGLSREESRDEEKDA
jgi:mannose-6-phosphate isomerase-like protein (cupin superfamily)